MSMRINLTQGYSAEVDEEDYERVSQHRWYVYQGFSTMYAESNGPGKGTKLHRFILGLDKGDEREVDHIDRDGLNNRRNNIRICSHQQNAFNQKPQQGRTSIFKGVHKRSNGKWRVYIKFNGKQISLGHTTDQYLAAVRYDMAAVCLFGRFARLNYPDMMDEYLEQLEDNDNGELC